VLSMKSVALRQMGPSRLSVNQGTCHVMVDGKIRKASTDVNNGLVHCLKRPAEIQQRVIVETIRLTIR